MGVKQLPKKLSSYFYPNYRLTSSKCSWLRESFYRHVILLWGANPSEDTEKLIRETLATIVRALKSLRSLEKTLKVVKKGIKALEKS